MHTPIPAIADATGLRIGLAVSRYHIEVTQKLREGAEEQFLEQGGDESKLLVVPVPGAFELIAACRAFAHREGIDAAVAIACVITGETTHDLYINKALTHGISTIICQFGMPIGFGVLTCPSMDHARARAGGAKGNKGAEAMKAAIEMACTLRALRRAEGGE